MSDASSWALADCRTWTVIELSTPARAGGYYGLGDGFELLVPRICSPRIRPARIPGQVVRRPDRRRQFRRARHRGLQAAHEAAESRTHRMHGRSEDGRPVDNEEMLSNLEGGASVSSVHKCGSHATLCWRDGFEPSVPRKASGGVVVSLVVRAHFSVGGGLKQSGMSPLGRVTRYRRFDLRERPRSGDPVGRELWPQAALLGPAQAQAPAGSRPRLVMIFTERASSAPLCVPERCSRACIR
jgi:hypothetical protein